MFYEEDFQNLKSKINDDPEKIKLEELKKAFEIYDRIDKERRHAILCKALLEKKTWSLLLDYLQYIFSEHSNLAALSINFLFVLLAHEELKKEKYNSARLMLIKQLIITLLQNAEEVEPDLLNEMVRSFIVELYPKKEFSEKISQEYLEILKIVFNNKKLSTGTFPEVISFALESEKLSNERYLKIYDVLTQYDLKNPGNLKIVLDFLATSIKKYPDVRKKAKEHFFQIIKEAEIKHLPIEVIHYFTSAEVTKFFQKERFELSEIYLGRWKLLTDEEKKENKSYLFDLYVFFIESSDKIKRIDNLIYFKNEVVKICEEIPNDLKIFSIDVLYNFIKNYKSSKDEYLQICLSKFFNEKLMSSFFVKEEEVGIDVWKDYQKKSDEFIFNALMLWNPTKEEEIECLKNFIARLLKNFENNGVEAKAQLDKFLEKYFENFWNKHQGSDFLSLYKSIGDYLINFYKNLNQLEKEKQIFEKILKIECESYTKTILKINLENDDSAENKVEKILLMSNIFNTGDFSNINKEMVDYLKNISEKISSYFNLSKENFDEIPPDYLLATQNIIKNIVKISVVIKRKDILLLVVKQWNLTESSEDINLLSDVLEKSDLNDSERLELAKKGIEQCKSVSEETAKSYYNFSTILIDDHIKNGRYKEAELLEDELLKQDIPSFKVLIYSKLLDRFLVTKGEAFGTEEKAKIALEYLDKHKNEKVYKYKKSLEKTLKFLNEINIRIKRVEKGLEGDNDEEFNFFHSISVCNKLLETFDEEGFLKPLKDKVILLKEKAEVQLKNELQDEEKIKELISALLQRYVNDMDEKERLAAKYFLSEAAKMAGLKAVAYSWYPEGNKDYIDNINILINKLKQTKDNNERKKIGEELFDAYIEGGDFANAADIFKKHKIDENYKNKKVKSLESTFVKYPIPLKKDFEKTKKQLKNTEVTISYDPVNSIFKLNEPLDKSDEKHFLKKKFKN